MYRGFNMGEVNFPDGSYELGEVLHAKHKAKVKPALSAFISENKALDASKMQSNWFPSVNADVFISHSHQDERTAISLAGWLSKNFNLVAFVDSCVWGYSDQLLKQIDDTYCFQTETNTYHYEKRNRSTSHVHMMLSVALAKMLDSCECIIFLNTPSSIVPSDTIKAGGDAATLSPWIYSEVAMTRLLRQRSRESHRGMEKVAKKLELGEGLSVSYAVRLDHFSELSLQDLKTWLRQREKLKSDINSLDILYSIKGLIPE
jgi:hypothetical protein